MGIEHNNLFCLFYCEARRKCISDTKLIPNWMPTCKDMEQIILEKFTVGEVYTLWQQAYKKAYGVFPTRANRPTKHS